MGEKKKLFLVIIGGLAGLFFLTTNIFMPIYKDNIKHLAEYKKLKQEVETIESLGANKLDSLEEQLDSAVSVLEKKFIPAGKLRLTEHLTQVPVNAKIVFNDIAYRKPQEREEYQIFPVEMNIKAAFYDLLKYLAKIETNPLMIGIDNLALNKIRSGENYLDTRVTFVGFRLMPKTPSASKYLDEAYQPLDERHLKNLMEPVASAYATGNISELKDSNPFVYDFDKLAQGQEEQEVELPQEKIPSIDNLILKGILSIAGQKAALINDNIVKEGEKIAGMDVVEIQDYKVVLMQAEKKYILKIGVDDELIRP